MEGETKISTVLQTKLHRPPLDRFHVHRHATLDRLTRHLHQPLTMVSAPAGYGKSTLMSCWLQTTDIRSTWVSLDENDNDLRIFLSYLVTAVRQVFPTACAETLSMLKVAHLPSVSILARSLVNELDQINEEFIIALDDYHVIRDKEVHELLAKLLNHPPARMRIVLIGRRDPPLPLTSLRAKGQMLEVGIQELRFSLDETADFLQQLTGAPVDTSIAAILEEKTEGWVTGLRLAALSMQHQKNLRRFLADLPVENQYVMDYVVSEILSHHSPAVQECMLKISLLSRFCASLCEALCYADTNSNACEINCRDFLKLLDRANLFVIPLDAERKWFRYHHLFQSLLKRQLKQQLKRDEIAKLYQLASAWFAENGYIEEALSYALESGDKAAAARLVKQNRHDLMNREQWYHLNRWLKRFPSDFIPEDPDLFLAKAWVYQRQARHSELFDILAELERTVSISNNKSAARNVLRGEVQTLKSFKYYSTGLGELAETNAREALNNLPARFYNTRGYALLLLSLALQMKGDPRQAQRVVFQALQEKEASIPVYKTMLLAALCYASWIDADSNSLKPAADQLLKHGQKHDLPETIAVGRFFTGILYYQCNDLDLAERYLAPVVCKPVAGELVVPSIVTYCQSSFALSLTLQAMGRAKEACEIVSSVIGYMLETGNAELLEICKAFQADLALRRGHIAEADYWARKQTPKPLVPAYRFYTPHLVLPKVLLARLTPNSLRDSDRLLSQIYDYYEQIHSYRVLIDVLCLQALLRVARGDEPEALQKLAQALALAEPGGFIRPFLDLGPDMADLLCGFADQNPTQPYAGQILNAFDCEKTGTSRDKSNNRSRPRALIEPLTKREIEILTILAKGLSNNEIAESLFISIETVKRHLSTIYGKLDVKNRHQAVISAKSIGIL